MAVMVVVAAAAETRKPLSLKRLWGSREYPGVRTQTRSRVLPSSRHNKFTTYLNTAGLLLDLGLQAGSVLVPFRNYAELKQS